MFLFFWITKFLVNSMNPRLVFIIKQHFVSSGLDLKYLQGESTWLTRRWTLGCWTPTICIHCCLSDFSHVTMDKVLPSFTQYLSYSRIEERTCVLTWGMQTAPPSPHLWGQTTIWYTSAPAMCIWWRTILWPWRQLGDGQRKHMRHCGNVLRSLTDRHNRKDISELFTVTQTTSCGWQRTSKPTHWRRKEISEITTGRRWKNVQKRLKVKIREVKNE